MRIKKACCSSDFENPFEPPREVGTGRPVSDGNPLTKTLLAIGGLGAALLLAILLVVILIVFVATQYKSHAQTIGVPAVGTRSSAGDWNAAFHK